MGAAIIVLLLLKINVNKEISCSGYFLHIDKLKKKKKTNKREEKTKHCSDYVVIL